MGALADNYSAAPGVVIRGGRFGPPAWLPAPGQRASVSLNTVSSVYPTSAPDTRTRGSVGLLQAWCSTAYVPTLGLYGSIIVWGGGHADYVGNEMYRYDIATRLFTRIIDPWDPAVSYTLGVQCQDPTDGDGTGGGVADRIYGEYWADDHKNAVVTNERCPTHTYGGFIHIPGAAVGNTNGWVVAVGNIAPQNHYWDMDSPSLRSRRLGGLLTATGRTELPGYGSMLFDATRSKIMCFPYNNGAQPFRYTFDIPSGTVGSANGPYADSYYTVSGHMVSDDLYVLAGVGAALDAGRWKFFVQDPATNLQYSPATSGTLPPTSSQGTTAWVEQLRQLVYWPGTGITVYFLTPPANPRTGTWVWTSRDFPGDAPATMAIAVPMYARLHYVPPLNAFIHVATTTGAVQIWSL